jgi:hypothetical protein
MSMTRSAGMGCIGGAMGIATRAISLTTSATGTGRCNGTMGPSTRACGHRAFRMERERLYTIECI